ncbi:MAG: hypothetical protein WCF04_04720, partial [Candidatus Nanopelagicales bacterium]
PLAADETPVEPRIATGIPVRYLDPAASWAASVGAVPGSRLAPGVIARVKLRFDDTRADVVHEEEYEAVLFPIPDIAGPEQFRAVDYDDRDLLITAPPGAIYSLPPSEVGAKAWWTGLQRGLADLLMAARTIDVPTNPGLSLYGRVGETAEQFSTRCAAVAQDAADTEVARLQSTYETKLAAIQRRIDTAEQAVERQRSARTSALATDMLSGLFGGRTSITGAARRAATAQGRVAAAADKVDDLERAMVDLRLEWDSDVAGIRAKWTARAGEAANLSIGLERTDVKVTSIGLVWIPRGT